MANDAKSIIGIWGMFGANMATDSVVLCQEISLPLPAVMTVFSVHPMMYALHLNVRM